MLSDMPLDEVLEFARKKAEQARRNDERMGEVLGDLMTALDEMSRRLDDG